MKNFLLVLMCLGAFACAKDKDDNDNNSTSTAEPKACFDVEIDGAIISLNTSCSENANSYQWDFGNEATATEANPSYEYDMPGEFTITLTAKASNGKTASTTKTITIEEYCATCMCSDGNFAMTLCNTKQAIEQHCAECEKDKDCNCQ